MKCLLKTCPVSPKKIDFTDTTFHLLPWDEQPDDSLIASIKQFGVLHPPFLFQEADTDYRIITGRKRLRAARHHCQTENVICHIVPHDMEQKQIFALLLEETLGRRSMSPVEQVFFFEKYLNTASPQEALHLLEKLGHKPREYVLNKLLRLQALPPAILLALHRNTIPIKNAEKLLAFSHADQECMANLISDLKLGGSKQRKLIEFCKELSLRKKKSIDQILADCPIHSSEKQAENIPQQASAILTWLEKECFPQYYLKEEDFRRNVASLPLPKNMSVAHTPSFEDDEIALTIRFANWRVFESALQKIRQHSDPDK